MYVDIPRNVTTNLPRVRVPIYSASSWASIMSQDAAFYLDPLRDIYEVPCAKLRGWRSLDGLIIALGIHHLHIFPTSHQFSWRRTLSHHNDAWKTACASPLAPHILSC